MSLNWTSEEIAFWFRAGLAAGLLVAALAALLISTARSGVGDCDTMIVHEAIVSYECEEMDE